MENNKSISQLTPEENEWIHQLCLLGKKDEAYYKNFLTQLDEYPDVLKELLHYAYNSDFLGEVSIEDFTVVDILVWQIDHFKSHMDRGEYDMQSNPEHMILMAFDTMLQMKKNPLPFILQMKCETGTDYADKF